MGRKRMKDHKDRIDELEKEVETLKKMVEMLMKINTSGVTSHPIYIQVPETKIPQSYWTWM